MVHLVITLGLEEEVADLPAGHRQQPADQRGRSRPGEHQDVRTQEACRAEEVERLIDPAVVVIAVIVPPLQLEGLKEAVHGRPFLTFLDSAGLLRSSGPPETASPTSQLARLARYPAMTIVSPGSTIVLLFRFDVRDMTVSKCQEAAAKDPAEKRSVAERLQPASVSAFAKRISEK